MQIIIYKETSQNKKFLKKIIIQNINIFLLYSILS